MFKAPEVKTSMACSRLFPFVSRTWAASYWINPMPTSVSSIFGSTGGFSVDVGFPLLPCGPRFYVFPSSFITDEFRSNDNKLRISSPSINFLWNSSLYLLTLPSTYY